MTVKSLIRREHTWVVDSEPVATAWQLLSRREISLVAVTSKDQRLVGVIGEDDLLYRLVPDYREYFSEFFPDCPDLRDLEDKLEREMDLTVSDVMNRRVVTIVESQPVFKALAKMMAYHVRVLPVIAEGRKFLGMISEDDIMKELFERHLQVVNRKGKR